MLVVRTYSTRIDAELAHSALEAAGIDSMIRADDVGGTRPAFWLLTGVTLLVRRKDMKRAEAILGPQQ